MRSSRWLSMIWRTRLRRGQAYPYASELSRPAQCRRYVSRERERSLLQSPDEFPPAASIRKIRRTRPHQAQGSYDNAEHISPRFRPHPTLSPHHSDLDYVATMPAEEAVKAPVLIRQIWEAIGYCVPLPHLLRPGFLTHYHSFS